MLYEIAVVRIAVATVSEPSNLTLILLGIVLAGLGLWLGPFGHKWSQLDRQLRQRGGDREPGIDFGVEPMSEEKTPIGRAISAGKPR